MALLKNNVANRQIGYKIYAWRKALQNPDFVGIDEHGITNALRMTFFDKFAEKFNLPKENKLLNFLRRIKTKKHYFVEQYTTPFTSIPWIDGSLNSSQPDEWYYEEGIVKNSRDSNRCFIYLHLMNFKSSKWRADNTLAPWEKLNNYYDVRNINNKIRIDKHGIREIK